MKRLAYLAFAVAMLLASQGFAFVSPGATITDTGPMAWGPSPVTILVGQSVNWTWTGCHSVVSDNGSDPYTSGSPVCGSSFNHIFNTVGDYPYHCGLHGLTMSGMIHVVAPSPTITPTFTSSPTSTVTPTFTQTFGCQNINAMSSFAGSNPTSGMIHYQRFSVASDTTLGAVGFFKTGNAANAHAALYDDNGGAPGNLLAQSGEVAMGFHTIVEFPLNYPLVGGTTYWMAFQSDNGGWFVYNSPGYNGYFQLSTSYSSTFPSTGAGAGLWNSNYCTYMYALICNSPYTATASPSNSPTVSPTFTASPTVTATPTPTNLTGCMTLGNNGNPDATTGGSLIYFLPIQVPVPGVLNAIAVYVPYAATTGHVAVFADSSGAPGALIAESAEQSLDTGAWTTVIIPATSLSPGAYWLATQTNGGSSGFSLIGGGSYRYLNVSYNSSFPTNAGGAAPGIANSEPDQYAIFCDNAFSPTVTVTSTLTQTSTASPTMTVSPSTTPTSLAGCLTLGNAFGSSGDTSSQQIAFQQITLPAPALLNEIVIYHGNFAVNGHVAIYDDNSGSPGSLVAQSAEISMPSNSSVHFPMGSSAVGNGTYWLAVQSVNFSASSVSTAGHTIVTLSASYASSFPSSAAGASTSIYNASLDIHASFCDAAFTPTPSFTVSPTMSSTYTESPTMTNSPTVTATPTATPTYTPYGGLKAPGGRLAVLGPVPVKRGMPLCLALAALPSDFSVDLYGTDGAKAAGLTGQQASEACLETSRLAPGLYYGRIKIHLRDGRSEERSQKAIILP